jgi:hypothetical protein
MLDQPILSNLEEGTFLSKPVPPPRLLYLANFGRLETFEVVKETPKRYMVRSPYRTWIDKWDKDDTHARYFFRSGCRY